MSVSGPLRPEQHVVATSPWLKQRKTAAPKRIVLVQVDEYEYAVYTQVYRQDGIENSHGTYRIQFDNETRASKNNALKLAFVVFAAASNHHVLHSQWVEHVTL